MAIQQIQNMLSANFIISNIVIIDTEHYSDPTTERYFTRK